MKQKDRFRYAEKCLYEYQQNMSGLEVLREDLKKERAGTDVHAQNYEVMPGATGQPSNPVQSRVMRIEHIEGQIKQLERWTKPVTQMIENLKNEVLNKILEQMYFNRMERGLIISELKVSRRTFYYKRRELVYIAISYLAL